MSTGAAACRCRWSRRFAVAAHLAIASARAATAVIVVPRSTRRVEHQQLHAHSFVDESEYLVADGGQHRRLRQVARQLLLQFGEEPTREGRGAAGEARRAARRVDAKGCGDDVPAAEKNGEYRCECISTVFIASLRIRSGRLRLPLSQLRTQPRLLPLSPRSSPSPFLMVAGPVAALLLSSSLSLFL